MDVIHGSKNLTGTLRAPVVAIGNFDGVHVGHRRLLELARERADALGGQAVALSFDPHPAKVLAPRLAPPLICTPERKAELIAATGMDVLCLEPFDLATAAQAADEFVAATLVENLGVREVVVGYDFTYGKGRGGNTQTLAAAGGKHDFAVSVVPQVAVNGLVASSTKIRELLHEGNAAGARVLLGRDFDVDGTVVRGEGRGKALGFPTANIATQNELLPRPGIYATRVTMGGVAGGPWIAAATSLGTNPTFGGGALSLEAYLLDYAGDLYGKTLRVAFVAWLRGEERFASVPALIEKIHDDVARTRAALEGGA